MTNDFEKAGQKLAFMDKVIGASLEKAAAAGAQPVREETERRAPRGATLDLASSVDDEPVESSKNRAVHAVVVREYYAYFHEYGTDKMTARPFLRPAIDAMQMQSNEAIADVILSASRSVTG